MSLGTVMKKINGSNDVKIVYDSVTTMGSRELTANGYLYAKACLTKTGVFDYKGSDISDELEPNKIYKVYRPLNVIEDKNTILSMRSMPVTNEHPPVLLNSKNTKSFSVGFTSDSTPILEDGKLITNITVTDKQTIDSIMNGDKCDISIGYTCKYVKDSGVTSDGIPYEFVQKDITGNHTAVTVTGMGRCGNDCKVFDSTKGENLKMVDKVENSEASDTKGSQANIEDRLKSVEDMCSSLDSKLSELMKTGKKDDAEAKDSTVSLDSLATELADTRVKAAQIMPTMDFKGKTSEQIKRDVITHKFKNISCDSLSSDYISGLFHGIEVKENKGNALIAEVNKAITAKDSKQGNMSDEYFNMISQDYKKKN